jgi:Flp pilus assembly protein TadD
MPLLVGLAAALALCGLGTRWVIRRERLRAAWAAVRPPPPDLAAWPAAFRTRVAEADRRLAAWPPDLAALGDLARLYQANGFIAAAEKADRGLMEFDPTNPQWPHVLGVLLADSGEADQAIPLFRRAVLLDPGDLPARLHLGDTLLKSNQTAAAAEAYQALLDRAPSNPYAMLGLARVALAEDRLGAARALLRRLIVANPDFYSAHSLLVALDEQFGDDEGAAIERDRAGQSGRFREAPDPWVDSLWRDCFDVYRLQVLGATAISVHAYADALPPLQRALQLAPNEALTHHELGEALLRLGDAAGANQHLARAKALDPNDAQPGSP